ncbi:MAG: ribose-phosphate pyrophosphokinase [Pseudomonadota bacterium]
MKPILLALPGTGALASGLAQHLSCEVGSLEIHRFPDGESCPRLPPGLARRDVVLLASLDHPDRKLVGLYLTACVARELGARSIGLVAPYLPYMRQDAVFVPGQGITARHVAAMLSGCVDWLVTVDPHLHRFRSLSDLYPIPSLVVPAAPEIARWIRAKVAHPLLVGPDQESEQWVAQVASEVGCGYTILDKVRSGDQQVTVSVPGTLALDGCTPVLIDDIASTGRTMRAAVLKLKAAGSLAPVCIAVHALFCGDAFAELGTAGADCVVSCNSVEHVSNLIDLSAPLAAAVRRMLP